MSDTLAETEMEAIPSTTSSPSLLPSAMPSSFPSPVEEVFPAPSSAPCTSEPEYKYGYRYVRQVGPDGVEHLERVPLTRENVLHPQVGEVHLNNDPHQVFCLYLYAVFMAQLSMNAQAVVFHDVGIIWDIPGLKHHSPDLSVILGVKKQQKWSTFNVHEEGVRPSLVMEVTSPETRSIDLEDKKREYALAGVPLYVVIDMESEKGVRPLELLGYELGANGYVPLQADKRGRPWLEPVQLWIGIKNKRVEC